MNINNNKYSGWILCPSKTFPGKLYYFNVSTGETAWSVSDSEAKSLNKHSNTKYANYPEPLHHPEDDIINISNKHALSNQNNIQINRPCLKTGSNFISAPIISSTQEFFSNSNRNIPDVDSPTSNYVTNPFDFSTPKTKNDYSTKTTEYATSSNPTDFATPSNPTDFTTPGNPIDFATPSTPELSIHTIRFPSIKIHPLKLVVPSFGRNVENVPQYIWAPIPIEFVNDNNVNRKTKESHNRPSFVPTSEQNVMKQSVKQHPLTTLNETETNKTDTNLTNEDIRPKIDNLQLIKKFRDQFNCNNVNDSKSTIESNLNSSADPVEPKFVRKIVKLPEFESKIASKEVITFQGDVTPKKTLSQSDKVETKEDKLDNLSENDLRTLLVKRKLESNKNNGVPEKKTKSDPRLTPATPKKKVTFKLDLTDEETSEECHENVDEEPERPKNPVLLKLRQLGPIENTEWYIVVDSNVLMDSFEFINKFVQDDPLCKLVIPCSVYYCLSVTSVGDSRGLRRVQVARQTLRRIDVATKSNHVILEKPTDANEKFLPQEEQVQNCCLRLMFNEIHVVLITDNDILYNEAFKNGIHAFKIEEIQNLDDNASKLSFDFRKFKFSVPNGNCLSEKEVNDNTNLNVPNSNGERIEKNLFGAEKSLNTDDNSNVPNLVDLTNLSDISECTMIITDIQTANKMNPTSENSKSTENFDQPEKVLSTYFTQEKKEFKIPNFKNFIIHSKTLGNKVKETQMKDTGVKETQFKVTGEKKSSIFEIESNFMPVTSKTIEDELKRFNIKNKAVQENLEKRKDEYFCCFRQILEGLYDILQDIPILKANSKKIWSLYDLLEALRKNGEKKIQLIAEKVIALLYEYDCQGTAKMKMNHIANDLMQIIGSGILLVQNLKELKESQELLEMENNLNDLLNSVENPEEIEFDVTPPDVAQINKKGKEQDRRNFNKPRIEIIEYLKKHYSQWKDYEVKETDGLCNGTQKSSKVNIVRTLGKNISSIKLNRTKRIMESITKNAEPKPINNTLETEKNSLKNGEILIQNGIDKSDLNNKTNLSKAGPIMIRTLNGVAQEKEKVNYNFMETKHENTFDASTNGPKFICKMAPIRQYEEKIKIDLNKLDYSELSNAESKISDLLIITNDNSAQIDSNEKADLKNNNIGIKTVNKCLNGELLNDTGLMKTNGSKTAPLINDSKRTESLNDGSKRTHSLTEDFKTTSSLLDCNGTNTQTIQRTGSLNDGSKRTRPLTEDRNSTLSPSLIIDDNINVHSGNRVLFIKQFLIETVRSFRSIIMFSQKCLRALKREDLKMEEMELIKNKAIQTQNGINKLVLILRRIIDREEKQNTFTTLLSKEGKHVNYINIIEQCLEQVNSIEYVIKLILLQTFKKNNLK